VYAATTPVIKTEKHFTCETGNFVNALTTLQQGEWFVAKWLFIIA